MHPRKKVASNFLGGSAKRMESLLVDWANTTTVHDGTMETTGRTDAAIQKLIAKYPEFFAAFPPSDGVGPIKSSTVEFLAVSELQTFLRLAWEATDLRRREWFIFQARHAYYQLAVLTPLEIERLGKEGEEWKRLAAKYTAARYDVPALSPFERVAYHFQRRADMAKRCANPECHSPYFFAKRHTQKYCSPECSDPAQVEQKRLWWRKKRGKDGGTE